MGHRRKQYEMNKNQRNFVAKNNKHVGGVHGTTHKAKRKHVKDRMKVDPVEDDEYIERMKQSDT